MKKKFISVMALSLCLCMGAMVGCGDKKNSSNEPPKPLTQDEILAKIGEAYAATKAYKDGYTVAGTNKEEYKDFTDEEAEVYTGALELTANPSQKLMYYKESGEEGYEIQKLIKNGSDYVLYGEAKEDEGEVEKDYTKYTEAYASYYVNKYYSYENMIDNYISAETFEIESIDAYNAAYVKVFAESVAEIEAGKDNEESMFYGYTASGSGTVSAVETADGAYVLTTKMTMEMNNSVQKTTAKSVQETVVTAKDGKLIGWKEVSENTRTQEVSDTETQTRISKSESSYTISYTFDQAKYDGVSVTIPDTVQPRNYYSKEVTVMINGVELETGYTHLNGSTIQGAIDYLMNSVIDNQINATAENATLTLYKDAAYTQAIDAANMTEAEFYALDTVYVKAELKEGYAFMNQVRGSAFGTDVTAEQKLVFGAMVGYTRQMQLSIVSVANPYNVAEKAEMMETQKVLVNGTEYAEDTLTMESGKTYEVKFVEEVAKATLNIFMMF